MELPDSTRDIVVRHPICIAASGPSLEIVLDDASFPADRLDIWALPSSLPALALRGITPSVIVSTDPGVYASLHYRGMTANPDSISVCPLTAYPGFTRFSANLTVIDQQSAFETALFEHVTARRANFSGRRCIYNFD